MRPVKICPAGLDPNFFSDLLIIYKGPNFVGSGEAGYELKLEAAVFRLRPQNKSF